MTYSYMKHHYGDNCFYGDTSYKRYARYHMPRASVNIFNVGGGGCYNTHHCCGGSWFGGGNFWSGLGLGLGAGLGNMFMGGLNMLGGWLGGGGLGFPSFGYGNYGGGYVTPFGLGTSASDGSHRRKARKDDSDLEPQKVNNGKKTDETDNTDNTDRAQSVEDADYGKINSLMDTSKLPDVNLFNEDSVIAYNTAIENAIQALNDYQQQDEINQTENTNQINKAKATLEKMRADYIDPSTIEEAGYTLQVNNEFVTINSVDDLNDNVISAIGDDKNKALAVLAAIRELRYDSMSPDFDNYHDDPNKTMHYVCGRLSTNYFVMKLYEKADIAVEVLKGNNSSGIKDHWYVGTVSEINTDGSFSFELNCEDNGIAGGTYRVTIDSNNKATIQQQGENGNWTTIKNGTEYDKFNRLLKAGPKTTQQQ